MKNLIKEEKGFTIFIAIVITGTLLLISTGIITLAVKEAFLTRAARDSQKAFYAADSALECALYWDLKNSSGYSAFATSTTSTINCNEQPFTDVGGASGETRITINYGSECAELYVRKRTALPKTLIEAYGYNTCVTSNPQRVQRSVKVQY